MWPDSRWAPARGSFVRPVLPPNVDPGAAPTRTFTINCSWLPFIRGALTQLVLQATWKTDDPAALTLAQARAMTLISMFTECSELVLPFDCTAEFENSPDPFQTWTIGFSGQYEPLFGYGQTGPVASAGTEYTGVEIICTLGQPIDITSLSLTFDAQRGNITVPAGNGAVYMYDDTHGILLNEITYGSLADGPNQTLTFTGLESGIDVLRFGVYPEAYSSGSHDPSTTALIRSIRMVGDAPHSPC